MIRFSEIAIYPWKNRDFELNICKRHLDILGIIKETGIGICYLDDSEELLIIFLVVISVVSFIKFLFSRYIYIYFLGIHTQKCFRN